MNARLFLVCTPQLCTEYSLFLIRMGRLQCKEVRFVLWCSYLIHTSISSEPVRMRRALETDDFMKCNHSPEEEQLRLWDSIIKDTSGKLINLFKSHLRINYRQIFILIPADAIQPASFLPSFPSTILHHRYCRLRLIPEIVWK